MYRLECVAVVALLIGMMFISAMGLAGGCLCCWENRKGSSTIIIICTGAIIIIGTLLMGIDRICPVIQN